MKRNLVLMSAAVMAILWAGFVFAGARTEMRVSVPYDFYLEDQLLPAGNYQFEMGSGSAATASSVAVRSEDGTAIRLLVTLPDVDQDATISQLKFNQYGEKHYLSSISIRGHKATLKMPNAEKELKSQLKQEIRSDEMARR
jgi:hypothetical protein